MVWLFTRELPQIQDMCYAHIKISKQITILLISWQLSAHVMELSWHVQIYDLMAPLEITGVKTIDTFQ